MLNTKKLSIATAVATSISLGTFLLDGTGKTQAATLLGSIDLKTGIVSGDIPNDFVSFVQFPVNEYADSYYETVLKINLNPANQYKTAIFDVEYDANPWGMSVNIGDSATNNGHSGDGTTQSNDAEMQIGVNPYADIDPVQYDDMSVYGKDGSPQGPLATLPNIVGLGRRISLTVSNEYLGWDNHNGISGHLNSPYLFALNGQPDTEGPVNYDIYAAFNRSIDGIYRPGSGVSKVTISVSTPEPTSALGLLALGALGVFCGQKCKHQQKT